MTSTSSLTLLGLLSTTILTPAIALAQQDQDDTAGQQGQSQAGPPVEEIIVRGAYIPEPKRDTSQVSSFLSRDDFTRTGDDDVAASITRVTGVNLSRGKFVFVRGLGERFASVVLNGLELPSPEPLRRVAPLDIFPTEVLEGIEVQKTFSPQFNGDFGGGLINMETRTIPAESIFNISAKVGWDTQTTARNAVLTDGGELDFLGINDGTRDLSPELKAAFLSGQEVQFPNFSQEELQDIALTIPNGEINLLFEGDATANTEFGFTWAEPFEFLGADAGVFVTGNFRSDWQTRRGKRQTAVIAGDPTTPQLETDGDLFGTQLDTRWSGLASFGLDWTDHELKFTNLYVKSTTKENRIIQGFNANENALIRNDFVEWFDRELFTVQAAGDHFLLGDDLTVNWNFAYSDASRDGPFERKIGFIENNQGVLELDNIGGLDNRLRFSAIEDTVLAGSFEARYNVDLSDDLSAELYAGYDQSDTDRESAVRILSFQGSLSPEIRQLRPDLIFSPNNILNGNLRLEDQTGAQFDPAYLGTLEIQGFFAGAAVDIGPFVNIDAGVRVEDGQQIVDTFSPFSPNQGIETFIDETDVLPTFSVNYTFAENMQLRAAYSKTIGRPEFRELAFSEFQNVETDQLFIGNPFLTNPELDNVDLRWEWYFARDQFLTAGFFYKRIEDPIEEFFRRQGGGDTVQTSFQQVPKANLKGFEFELQRRFTLSGASFGMADFFRSKDFLFSLNYTFTDSAISINDGDTIIRAAGPDRQQIVDATRVLEDGLPLQGQADHILNVQIGFEDALAQSQFTILFNYASERIRERGEAQLPGVFARDPASLDVRYVKSFALFGQDLRVAFSARNLLGDDFRATQGEGENKIFVDTFEVGRSLSLSLTANF